MKGDFSRFTFDRRKHYAGVRLQQGRVQLDADWNEQDDIAAYQRHTLVADVIGGSGAPESGGGFEITVVGNIPQITAGRYYVDGILCENEGGVAITGQPDLPGFTLPTTGSSHLAYLDVWQRSVTALEDPDLLELALGGADTATRLRTVWQVKLRSGSGVPANWEPNRPTLAVRAAGDVTENQLYRIEVHREGGLGVATFKWSRDNGSVAALIENPAGSEEIRVTRQIGPDQAGGFETGHWIEVTDETRILKGQPGILAKVSSVAGSVLRVEGWPASDPAPDLPNNPQIRRWDSDGDPIATIPATNDGYIDLDGTLEVRFGGPANAHFRTGDYWLVSVRAAAGVLWPTDASDAPQALPPHGVQHHYAPLYALNRSGGGNWSVTTTHRKVFQGTTVEKLNRRQDDTMTASLTITGNLTVQGTPNFGAPVFLATRQLVRQGSAATSGWNHHDTLPLLPAGARAVILDAYGAKLAPTDPEGWIKIRTASTDPIGLILLVGRAAGSGDNIAWGGQGIFPLSNNTFEYIVEGGFNQGWLIHIVGYFP